MKSIKSNISESTKYNLISIDYILFGLIAEYLTSDQLHDLFKFFDKKNRMDGLGLIYYSLDSSDIKIWSKIKIDIFLQVEKKYFKANSMRNAGSTFLAVFIRVLINGNKNNILCDILNVFLLNSRKTSVILNDLRLNLSDIIIDDIVAHLSDNSETLTNNQLSVLFDTLYNLLGVRKQYIFTFADHLRKIWNDLENIHKDKVFEFCNSELEFKDERTMKNIYGIISFFGNIFCNEGYILSSELKLKILKEKPFHPKRKINMINKGQEYYIFKNCALQLTESEKSLLLKYAYNYVDQEDEYNQNYALNQIKAMWHYFGQEHIENATNLLKLFLQSDNGLISIEALKFINQIMGHNTKKNTHFVLDKDFLQIIFNYIINNLTNENLNDTLEYDISEIISSLKDYFSNQQIQIIYKKLDGFKHDKFSDIRNIFLINFADRIKNCSPNINTSPNLEADFRTLSNLAKLYLIYAYHECLSGENLFNLMINVQTGFFESTEFFLLKYKLLNIIAKKCNDEQIYKLLLHCDYPRGLLHNFLPKVRELLERFINELPTRAVINMLKGPNLFIKYKFNRTNYNNFHAIEHDRVVFCISKVIDKVEPKTRKKYINYLEQKSCLTITLDIYIRIWGEISKSEKTLILNNLNRFMHQPLITDDALGWAKKFEKFINILSTEELNIIKNPPECEGNFKLNTLSIYTLIKTNNLGLLDIRRIEDNVVKPELVEFGKNMFNLKEGDYKELALQQEFKPIIISKSLSDTDEHKSDSDVHEDLSKLKLA